MPDQPRPKWRCRWVRVSVRGLMALIVVIGAGLGWVVRSAQIQRDAVAAIRGHGGFVRYDGEERSGIYLLGGKLSVPRWLVDTVGVDYFDSVFSVYYWG
jgi:hypothetical protein